MSAWDVAIESAEYGTVMFVNVVATRKCGRIERFSVSHWPAGWRLGANNVPAAVSSAAMKLVKETYAGWYR